MTFTQESPPHEHLSGAFGLTLGLLV